MTGPPFTTGPLTTQDPDPILDMDAGVGQRSSTYRFALANGVTGEELGDITPLRSASLSHDTQRTVKRQLSLGLGIADAAAVNPLTDRVRPYMILSDGSEWPLGNFMFTDESRQQFTSGNLDNLILNDEMFLVDQEIDTGINGVNEGITNTIIKTLAGLPVRVTVEPSDFTGTQAWTIGSNRGQILEALSVSGDLFSPWFDNTGVLRFIRSFDPAKVPADFDYDSGHKVLRNQILSTSDILTAPNRFIVVSNAASNPEQPAVGTADIPVNAPNSFANRGFYIPKTFDLQVSDNTQAGAVAVNLALRQTIFERVQLTTAPDPRHDSYNVIYWRGSNWLELAWGIQMGDGGLMTHVLRKAYT